MSKPDKMFWWIDPVSCASRVLSGFLWDSFLAMVHEQRLSLFIYLLISLFINLFIGFSVCKSVCHSICYLSVHPLPIYLSVKRFMSVCLLYCLRFILQIIYFYPSLHHFVKYPDCALLLKVEQLLGLFKVLFLQPPHPLSLSTPAPSHAHIVTDKPRVGDIMDHEWLSVSNSDSYFG